MTPVASRPLPTHVAFLRGINVGGKNLLPMKDLVSLAHRAGAQDATSYIQSGNLLLRAAPKVAATFPSRLSDEIAQRFGFRVPVVVRTAEELRRTALRNPFLPEGVPEKALHVAFLADAPTAARCARLDPARSPTDRFVLLGKDVYLCCPEGLARTKLSNAYFDAQLETVSTVRSWSTVLKLLEKLEG